MAAGQFGAWTPIAAEQMASGGYQVAWKFGAADQYVVWNIDSDGNFLSQGAVVSAIQRDVESRCEPSFHQDINRDGMLGCGAVELRGRQWQFGGGQYRAADELHGLDIRDAGRRKRGHHWPAAPSEQDFLTKPLA